ncbi:hypothetical protein NNJEOMEG_00681 [Fundidesulfovibrio magnetotacticus]|uniref:Uncharacterized protein n=1 Tax=Fundidesulfovibrio magnetotacticus TaxID=2730080 RepID=A0A6V8LJF1_9BACT|nr:hypothetical protein [Fundidesulfovibrio magnetotacticus]GFK92853.1 hypothetical protein NNJEOMEG_00681 [Fundidesulfovibrio magnetotacticus]
MRILAALCLILFASLPALAQPRQQPAQNAQNGQTLTRDWLRIPRDDRTAYMTGASAGVRAYAESQPGTPMPAMVVVSRAVSAMDRAARDPLTSGQPMMQMALKAVMDSQDRGIHFVESGGHVRDPQFDQRILFDYPWLQPLDLEGFVATPYTPHDTFADSWKSAYQHQKLFFIQGFGDMAAARCLDAFGDTPKGRDCLRPLLPLPPEAVVAQMDQIYRDRRFAKSGYDLVIRAALVRMVGGDWEKILLSQPTERGTR